MGRPRPTSLLWSRVWYFLSSLRARTCLTAPTSTRGSTDHVVHGVHHDGTDDNPRATCGESTSIRGYTYVQTDVITSEEQETVPDRLDETDVITSEEHVTVELADAPREDVPDKLDETEVTASEDLVTVVLGDAPREDVPHRLDETYVITPKASAIGDAPHEDVPVTCGDLGVIRWCTRPSTGLTRSARALNKVARLRQAAQMWQPDQTEYVSGLMDSLTGEEFDACFPTEESLRSFTEWATHRWLQIQYGATCLRSF